MCNSVFITPFCRTVYGFYVAQAIYGVALSAVDVGLNVWVLEMWDKYSNPYMMTVHLFFGLGASSSSLISAPFLQKSSEKNKTMDSLELNSTINHQPHNSTSSHIWILYAIVSLFPLIASAIFCIDELCDPYNIYYPLKKSINLISQFTHNYLLNA